MSSVPVIISGVLWDDADKSGKKVTLYGEAVIAGLGVGGGPVIPPGQPPGIWGPPGPWPTPPIHLPPGQGGSPPGIWGPTDPRPTPPIYIPPTTLPELPDHIWGPTDPRPNPPIYLPEPTPPDGSLIDWKPVWTPDTGWVVIGVPNVPHPTPSK